MKKINTVIPGVRYVKILWHEGTGEFNGNDFEYLDSLQWAFVSIFTEATACYSKVKLFLHYENGTVRQLRIDVGTDDDYNPTQVEIGDYLKDRLSLQLSNH